MRYAAKVDSNQDAIVSTLRAAGAYVWIIGLPVDLLVGYGNHSYLMELKRDSKARMTPLQADFFKNWTGGTLCRVDSPDGALKMIGVIK